MRLEFGKNTKLMAFEGALDVIVPTVCYSHIKWNTPEGSERVDPWIDCGRLRAVIMVSSPTRIV